MHPVSPGPDRPAAQESDPRLPGFPDASSHLSSPVEGTPLPGGRGNGTSSTALSKMSLLTKFSILYVFDPFLSSERVRCPGNGSQEFPSTSSFSLLGNVCELREKNNKITIIYRLR